MFKNALGILHNKSDAEDVVQEAFSWIINNSEKVSQIPGDKMAFYIAAIVEHRSLNHIKKQKNHPTDDIDEHPELCSNISVEETAIGKFTVEKVKETVNNMPQQKDRYILQLRLFEEMTDSEISEIMGIPEKNVHVYYHRARNRLIEILKKEGL